MSILKWSRYGGLILVRFAGLCMICAIHLYSLRRSKLAISAYTRQKPPKGAFLRRHEPCSENDPCHFKLIADLDQSSVVDSDSLLFKSVMLSGSLSVSSKGKYTLKWDKPVDVAGKHNEAGRGMELSELLLTDNGQLLSFDDRTGIVYEHKNMRGAEHAYPRHVITEGDGETGKGMKVEWATRKDNEIWLGSFGKEYTGPNGETVNENNFWVVSIGDDGIIHRHNWKHVYNEVRRVLDVPFPGYAIHEAVNWSPIQKRWFFLPRRVSALPYSEHTDLKMGSNKMVTADEDFSDFKVTAIGTASPDRGFSSFKFLPGSDDRIIMALKSEEFPDTGIQKTYVSVFTIDGEMLLDEVEVPVAHKFEGLEFVK